MIGRYGFVFPGQGSQYVGMGADLIHQSPVLQRTLRAAAALTGYDVETAMLAGPVERLTETAMTQLSVFALSTGLAAELKRLGMRPSAVAGHSLGEFTALVVGGWLGVDEALVLIAQRGEAMARACHANDGAMAAVVGLDSQAVSSLCVGGAVIANANSPVQVVVSGPRAAVMTVGAAATDRGAAVIPLDVAGAFHSPLMATAAAEMAGTIAELPLRTGHTPLVSSVTGRLVTDLPTYRRALADQITDQVRWTTVMGSLSALRIEKYIEVGPGRALRGLLKRTNRQSTVDSCGNWTECHDLCTPRSQTA